MEKSGPSVWPVPDITLRDVRNLERFHVRRYIEVDGILDEEEGYEPLQEEIMDKLESLTGDLKGRVTVGSDFGSSVEFGMKAGASVFMAVSCDSSEAVMEEVCDVLHPLAEKKALESHARMSRRRDKMLEDPSKALGDRCPVPGGDKKKKTRPKRSSGFRRR